MSTPRHNWNRKGKWGSHQSGDARQCLTCGLIANRAKSAGWELTVPGTTCRKAWRWALPPCFGKKGARQSVSWYAVRNGRRQ